MTELVPAPACLGCDAPLKPGAAFCAKCGRRVVELPRPAPAGELGLVIRFYVALLGIAIATMIYVKVADQVFEAEVAATIGFALVTLLVAAIHRDLVLPAYRSAGFSPVGYLLILLAAPVVLAIVVGYVDGLAHLFRIHLPRELEAFDGRNFAWPFLLVAVAPPLIEELGFRGIIYGALKKHLSVTEVFLISSFAFALLHMAIPSLLTHFPLGLYLCWLRHRSGSLWPPAFAHLCHNLGVMAVDWYRVH